MIGMIGAIVMSIAGCSAASDKSQGSASKSQGSAKYSVLYLAKALDSPYWISVTAGAVEAAKEFDNLVLTTDAGTSEAAVEEQISKVEAALARGIDALVISPTAPDQLRPVLERVIAAGIPVVLVDENIPDLKGVVSYVGSDNLKGGNAAAKLLKEQFPNGAKLGVIAGSAGINATTNRILGLTEGLKGSNIEIVATTKAEGSTRDHGVTAAQDLLTAHPEIDAIFCVGDEIALGAVQAIKAAGIDMSKIYLVGYDGNATGVDSILAGEMDATIAQFPTRAGAEGVRAAMAALAGKSVASYIDTGVEVITRDNAGQYANSSSTPTIDTGPTAVPAS